MPSEARDGPSGGRLLRRLNLALLLVGAAGLVVLVFTIDRQRLGAGLRQLGVGVLLAGAVHAAVLFTDALILTACASRPLSGRFVVRAFRATVAGHAVGMALHLGEVTKFALLRDELGAEPLASALLLQNLLWFETNCLLIVVCGVLGPPLLGLGGWFAAGLHAVAGLFLALAVGTPLVLRTGPWRWPYALLRRLGVPAERVERASAFVDRMAEAMRLWSRARGQAVLAAGLALISRVLSAVEIAVILAFLRPSFHPLVPLLSLMNAQLVFWLTVFVPFQVGTAEGGQYLFYGAIGLEPALGVVVELTKKAVRAVFIVVGLVILGSQTLRRIRAAR